MSRIEVNGNLFVLAENPTTAQVLNMLARSSGQELKGLAVGDNVYWWDSFFATHGDIAWRVVPNYWDDPNAYNDGRMIIGHGCDDDPTLDCDAKMLHHPRVAAMLRGDQIAFVVPGAGCMTYSQFLAYESGRKDWWNVAESEGHAMRRDNLVEARMPAGFKKWFGNSKVVDENGKPLLVYHGTKDKSFTVFDSAKIRSGVGFWFTSDRLYAMQHTTGIDRRGRTTHGRVVEAYLSIQNPALTTEDYDRGIDMEGRPYDGFIRKEQGIYVAFRSDQITIVRES